MPQSRRQRMMRPGVETAARTVRGTRDSLGRPLAHPADRTEDRRGRFDQFAEQASFLASSPLFFVVCAIVVGAWVLGLLTGAGDRFLAVASGLMSAVTLVLVALLKNAELRAERAVQTKLDAIASALLEDRRGHQGDAELRLEESIGVHEEI